MAASKVQKQSVELEDLKCSICLEVYKNPKALPCLHSFCQSCLQTYINSFKEKECLKRGFPCPVCRSDTTAPSPGKAVKDWAMGFPSNYALASVVRSVDNGTTDKPACEPCSSEKESGEKAHRFCLQCNEYLCRECVTYHKKFKPTKTHTLLPPEEIGQTGNKAYIYIGQTCDVHSQEEIKYFCKDDDALCCSTCAIVDHRSCKKIIEIQSAANGIKSSSSTLVLKRAMDAMCSQLSQVTNCLEENSKALKRHLDTIPGELDEIKEHINELFEDLKTRLVAESKEVYETKDSRNSEQVKRCSKLKAIIQSSCVTLNHAIQCGSERDVFITVRKLESQLSEYEKLVRAEEDKVKCEDFDISLDADVQKLVDMRKFGGEILVKESEIGLPSMEPFLPLKEQTSEFVGSVKVQRGHKPPRFTGATCLPDGRIVVIDSPNRSICLFDKNFKFLTKCITESSLWKVDSLGSNKIVVNMKSTKQIAVFSITSSKIEKEMVMPTSQCCQCLAVIDDTTFAVVWLKDDEKFAFGVIRRDGQEEVYLETDTDGREFKTFWHMALDPGKLRVFQPCKSENALFCFSLKGEPYFSYRNKDLNGVAGVAVDVEGNAYICGFTSNNIHRVDPDGNLLQIVAVSEMKLPLNVCFQSNTEFFISSEDKKDKLYRFKLSIESP